MAERPVFRATKSGPRLVEEVPIRFQWHPGLSAAQKKKSILEFHKAAALIDLHPLLEVSTKSEAEVGRRLSAFSLKMLVDANEVALECVFQGSKVFENGGPYIDLYHTEPWVAKKDPRLKSSGQLVGFEFEGKKFPLEPKTAFYDWLYVGVLYEHRDWLQRLREFAGFTDIEFNPEKSINCQARSLATFVALDVRQVLDAAMASFEAFAEVLGASDATQLQQSSMGSASFSQNDPSIIREVAVDLQRELCRAYVHFARRNEYKHQAFDENRIQEKMRIYALANIEDEGLISALGRLQRLIEVSKEIGIIEKSIGIELEKIDHDIKEVRDMREHYDQYIFGKGRKQQAFVKNYIFGDGNSVSANAKWSVQSGSEEVLGARLRIDDLAKALNSLREELENGKVWTLPHTAVELAKLSIASVR